MPERSGPTLAEISGSKQLVPNYASFYGESVMPPSDEGQKLTPEEFKEKFPVRYDVWNTLSQGMLGHSETGVSLNNPDTIQRLKTRLHVLNKLDRYITAHHSDENGRTLRERQMTVFEDIRDHLERGETQGYIKLPTGSGKTVIFTEVAEATDLKTLIVVPRQLLVDQTVERFQQFAPEMEVGKIYEGKKERGRHVEVTTYESMLSSIDSGEMRPEDYHLVVFDEVHKGLTVRRKEAADKFTNAIKLGFTATPNYSEQKQVSNILGTEIHSMTIREAVEEGILSPFSVYLVKTNTDISNVKVTANGDYDQYELEKAINNKERNLAAVQVYQELMKNSDNQGKLSIAYCAGIQHAKDLVDEFQAVGVSAGIIYGDQSKKQRDQILEDYRNGKIQVLCNAKLLIEGFDEPQTGIILNVTPTGSVVDAEQRGGRGLRLDPNNPNKHAIIVDIIDQTSNRQFHPLTFAQIVNGAYVYTGASYSYGSPGKVYPPRIQHPINIEGIQVITDPEEVLRIVGEEKSKVIDFKNGWMTYQSLTKELGRSEKTIRLLIETYLQEHPEWVVPYVSPGGKKYNFVHPDLVSEIKNNLSNTDKAPEGWMTAGSLMSTYNLDHGRIQRYADKYREEHPGWFQRHRDARNVTLEHYSPELTALIVNDLTSKSIASEGWKNQNQLAKELGVHAGTMKKIIDSFREGHPDWFKFHHDTTGRTSEHLSPELIEKIKESLSNRPSAPEGWLTINGITTLIRGKTGRGRTSISRIINDYKEQNPDEFKMYPDKLNRTNIHISPKAISDLEKKLGIENNEN